MELGQAEPLLLQEFQPELLVLVKPVPAHFPGSVLLVVVLYSDSHLLQLLAVEPRVNHSDDPEQQPVWVVPRWHPVNVVQRLPSSLCLQSRTAGLFHSSHPAAAGVVRHLPAWFL
jgi:hypothetical protein